ncbi:MAG: hypothetical protein RLZZ292_3857, partial [Bacteroidota bacterium]
MFKVFTPSLVLLFYFFSTALFAQSPSNNDCDGAITLQPSSSLTCGATVSGTMKDATGVAGAGDVWYKFTASSPYHALQFNNVQSPLANDDIMGAVVFRADACGNYTDKVLVYNYTLNSNAYFSKFEIGKTYYIRVYTPSEYSQITFDICVMTSETPPDNYRCDGALALPINPVATPCATKKVVNSTKILTYADLIPCIGGQQKTLWYHLTGTGESFNVLLQKVKNIGTEAFFEPKFAIFEGSCGTLIEKMCLNIKGAEQKVLLPTEVGKEYFIAFSHYGWDGADYSFELCANALPKTFPNDAIQTMTTVPVSTNLKSAGSVKVNTALATHSFVPNFKNYDTNILVRDLWYKFTALDEKELINIKKLDFTNIDGATHYISLINPVTETVQELVSLDNIDSSFILKNLVKNTTYYLSFLSYSPYETGFSCNLSITTPPIVVNDRCQNATSLWVNQNWSCDSLKQGTTRWATTDETLNLSAATSDVWYKFVATASQHQVTLQNIVASSNTVISTQIELFSSNNCTVFNKIQVSNHLYSGLEVGKTYFVRISSQSLAEQVFFDICVTTPISVAPNLTCQAATDLSLVSATSSVTQNAITALSNGRNDFAICSKDYP